MIIREPIRNSRNRVHARVFDLVIENGCMNLEIKNGKTVTSIAWEDVVSQVEAVRNRSLV